MKIFCIGKNYAKHAAEMNSKVPEVPLVFMKPSTALLENGKPFLLPDFSQNIHFEGELVLKINARGKFIPAAQAWDYVDQLTLGVDFTARDVQARCKEKGHPWEVSKAFDHSAAIGDFIPIARQTFPSSRFELQINGESRQTGDPNDMIFDVPTIISFISERFTLEPGDLIFTGTPEGVGQVYKGDLIQLFLNDKCLLTTPIR